MLEKYILCSYSPINRLIQDCNKRAAGGITIGLWKATGDVSITIALDLVSLAEAYKMVDNAITQFELDS